MISALLLAVALQAPAVDAPDGVFQARGYSWLIDRSGETFTLYHQVGEACWPDPDGAELESIFAHAVPLADGGIGLTEADGDQSTVYPFDKLAALPPACRAPDISDRAAVQAIVGLMDRHYPAFEARGVDWSARRATLATLPEHPAPAQAFAAAERLLAGFDDPHLDLSADIDGEERAVAASQGATLDAVHARGGDRPERAWLTAWREGVLTTVLDGKGHLAANNRLFWGVRDGVGYLTFVTMGGFDPEDDAGLTALDAALDEAMAAFAGVEAVIVDVSNNRGGYDSVGRHIAGRFADRTRAAYLKRAYGSGATAQVLEVRPSERARYLGPVWLLTSDITVSAGETFAQTMRVLPNVTHAGTATRGAYSDQIPVPLANGWRFGMPMELYTTPAGAPLEGRGLKPTVPLALYPAEDLDGGHARAVLALMRRLGAD